MRLCGVDYGSKGAGTTVISTLDGQTGETNFAQSSKNGDADRFLLDRLLDYQPAAVFLDAPLSLPGVYRDLSGCHDYFYRLADKQLKAMSPMFLGGLTARAMQLKAALERRGLTVYETYPAAQAQRMHLGEKGYKKELPAILPVLACIQAGFPAIRPNPGDVISWHHVDALLALVTAVRFAAHQQQVCGTAEEGVILV